MVFDGVGNGLRQDDGEAKMAGTTREREGGARRGNATTSRHDEWTRGRHNKMTMRDDATTSWHDETTRGGYDETMRR
jgi:hypothetical protein